MIDRLLELNYSGIEGSVLRPLVRKWKKLRFWNLLYMFVCEDVGVWVVVRWPAHPPTTILCDTASLVIHSLWKYYVPGTGPTSSSGQITTILVNEKRYDVQCYGEEEIIIFGRNGYYLTYGLNPHPHGKAPKGFLSFFSYSQLSVSTNGHSQL